MDEEEVLRQRLLAKETNLRNLTKRYLSFVNSIESCSVHEAETAFQGLLKELTAYEFTVLKASALVDTNLRQIADYDAMQQRIDAEMYDTSRPFPPVACLTSSWHALLCIPIRIQVKHKGRHRKAFSTTPGGETCTAAERAVCCPCAKD